MQLALFDLDHTLLSGDSDVLWCEFLFGLGLVDAAFKQRSVEVALNYGAGTVIPQDYYNFYASTMAGRTPSALQPLRERFLSDWIRPRIPDDARALLQHHRDAGDTLVLTTATSRVVSELTAADLRVDHYICTELELVDGRFTGRTSGVLNIRGGKVERLRQWLSEQGLPERTLAEASFYSDSINDMALLSVVRRPVVVDPDVRLASTARWKGWSVLRFNRGSESRKERRKTPR
jgi:HAD superfamily hydrolase (TIGR01490 family)